MRADPSILEKSKVRTVYLEMKKVRSKVSFKICEGDVQYSFSPVDAYLRGITGFVFVQQFVESSESVGRYMLEGKAMLICSLQSVDDIGTA